MPRWGASAVLVLQILIAVALPAGDAELEAASFATPTHVESPTDESCVHQHDHVFCQLCRALNLSAAPAGGGADVEVSSLAGIFDPGPHPRPGPSDVLRSGSLGARAPPSA